MESEDEEMQREMRRARLERLQDIRNKNIEEKNLMLEKLGLKKKAGMLPPPIPHKGKLSHKRQRNSSPVPSSRSSLRLKHQQFDSWPKGGPELEQAIRSLKSLNVPVSNLRLTAVHLASQRVFAGDVGGHIYAIPDIFDPFSKAVTEMSSPCLSISGGSTNKLFVSTDDGLAQVDIARGGKQKLSPLSFTVLKCVQDEEKLLVGVRKDKGVSLILDSRCPKKINRVVAITPDSYNCIDLSQSENAVNEVVVCGDLEGEAFVKLFDIRFPAKPLLAAEDYFEEGASFRNSCTKTFTSVALSPSDKYTVVSHPPDFLSLFTATEADPLAYVATMDAERSCNRFLTPPNIAFAGAKDSDEAFLVNPNQSFGYKVLTVQGLGPKGQRCSGQLEAPYRSLVSIVRVHPSRPLILAADARGNIVAWKPLID